MRRRLLPAALVAGVLSGAPSTLHAIVTGRTVLTTVRAAGELLGRPTIVRGIVAHGLLTVGWTCVLVTVLPGRNAVMWGAVAGGTIAALDLAIADRRFPAIAALPRLPQVADHLLFGALVGAVRYR
ncbi:MAG: hypothetical protein ACR2HQ_08640 [Ilumatobacteraceae bacterium]